MGSQSPEITADRDGVNSVASYHRRIRVEPSGTAITALLEDDFHAMSVRVMHADDRVIAIEPRTVRAPWTTCPGAEAKLVATFEGRPLSDVSARLDKLLNCTHLHDLAVLAVAHAHDEAPLTYAITVTDPVDGVRTLELWCDAVSVLQWREENGVFTAPDAIAGRTLFTLREWIASLPSAEREAARSLQRGAIVAHGRTIPLADQSDALAMPPNCYTFQPERAAVARRIGQRRDFSDGSQAPLDVFQVMS